MPGIDNVVFTSILAGKLREEQRKGARRTGLLLFLVAKSTYEIHDKLEGPTGSKSALAGTLLLERPRPEAAPALHGGGKPLVPSEGADILAAYDG